MKYLEKYPNAKYGEIYKDMVKAKYANLCIICNSVNFWIQIDFKVYICSEECNKKMWDNYLKNTCAGKA